MKLVVVTGMSGAGKTITLKMLEDMGFYCVDNLPIPLTLKFVELALQSPEAHSQVALGIDIRSGKELPQLKMVIKELKNRQIPHDILFLDASDKVLVKRFKETRRSHPLAGPLRIDQGIAMEREQLAFLKDQADYIMDTSRLLTRELRQELEKIFLQHQDYQNLFVSVLSFGFKYGIPMDADLVFDVRFLPNPFYVESLQNLTGNEPSVQEYVKKGGTMDAFVTKLYDMIDFLIPHFVLEGKNQLVIAIGCTGGKHRSVTVADALYRHLKEDQEIGVKIEHLDMEKDGCRKN